MKATLEFDLPEDSGHHKTETHATKVWRELDRYKQMEEWV